MNTELTIKIKDGIPEYENIKFKGDKLDDKQLLVLFTSLGSYFQLKFVTQQGLMGIVPVKSEPQPLIQAGELNRK